MGPLFSSMSAAWLGDAGRSRQTTDLSKRPFRTPVVSNPGREGILKIIMGAIAHHSNGVAVKTCQSMKRLLMDSKHEVVAVKLWVVGEEIGGTSQSIEPENVHAGHAAFSPTPAIVKRISERCTSALLTFSKEQLAAIEGQPTWTHDSENSLNACATDSRLQTGVGHSLSQRSSLLIRIAAPICALSTARLVASTHTLLVK
jgi:hypothetical protein